MGFVTGIAIAIFIILARCFRVINEYERAVIFRLGRVVPGAKGPGLIILVPILDKMVKVDMRTIVLVIHAILSSIDRLFVIVFPP